MKKQVLLLSLLIFLLPAYTLSAQGGASYRQMMAEISNRYDKSFVYESGLPLDQPYHGPALSGANLQRDLRLLFRDSGLTWTQAGHYIVLRVRRKAAGPPDASLTGPFRIIYDTLSPSRIVTVPDSPARPAERAPGDLARIEARDLSAALAFLGSPDLLRTLRALPGVAEGSDLASDLFVRGGSGGDNLYLLDGIPLYQTEHLYGFFSTFNTDVLDRTDFFKGAFPARFGGGVSSVLDIRSRTGDFERFHGNFALGLVDGRIQLEGPIVRGKTSFNLSVRRSWADPMLGALMNYPLRLQDENRSSYRYDGDYGFYDANAQLTHLFSDRSRLTARFYGGGDKYAFSESYKFQADYFMDATETKSRWNSMLASLEWDYRFGDGLRMTLTPFFTRYRSDYGSSDLQESWQAGIDGNTVQIRRVLRGDLGTAIDDAGLNAGFVWAASPNQTVRFGLNARYHHFSPEYTAGLDEITSPYDENPVSLADERNEAEIWETAEAAVYAEDEMLLSERFRLNLGLRAVGYGVRRDTKFRGRLEPRVSGEYRAGDVLSLIFSYAAMNQFAHRMRVQYVEIPSSFWMPATSEVEPLHSDQVTLGAVVRLPHAVTLGLDGWYKHMTHLYEYNGVYAVLPPFPNWRQRYSEGEGRSFGAETTFGYRDPKWEVGAAYTLSWSQRHFEEIYPDWYRDRNDSRHRLSLDATWRPGARWEIRAAWLFHSGYRVSFPAAVMKYNQTIVYSPKSNQLVFGEPFNVKLPDYHRLDLGVSFRSQVRRGMTETWSLGVYNAYFRKNPIVASLSYYSGRRQYLGYSTGFLPILPSLSYSLKF